MRRIAALLLLMAATPLHADSNLPAQAWSYTQLPDPAQEAQASALMQTIRCLVCQGQSVADSDAELAGDMRALIRQRIAAGESPQSVRKWLIDRYGDWISFDPPVEPATWPLWAAPAILILLGLWVASSRFKRRRS